jgi:hypothetical protein
VSTLGKLDGLRDRGVGRNARHEEKLCRAQAEQVEEIAVESDDAAAHALVEISVESRAASQHAVNELARPAAIARVQLARAAIERRIQQFTGTEVAADLGGGNARVSDAAMLAAPARP